MKERKNEGRDSFDEDDDFEAVDIIASVNKYEINGVKNKNEGIEDRIADATHVRGKRN